MILFKDYYKNQFYDGLLQEHKLLLCFSRTQISVEDLNQIQKIIVQQTINWNYLIKIGTEHGVIPLLYTNLKATCPEYIPDHILNQLQYISHRIALRSIIFTKELIEVITLLSEHEILALPFKGPVLAKTIYGSLSLRDFCDLDILVHPNNFLKTIDLLVKVGKYRTRREWQFLDVSQELSYMKSFGEYSLFKDIVFIDLHQFLTVERFMTKDLTFDYLWSRKANVSFGDKTLYTLGTEDQLLYLCIHGSKDCWRNLKWICDVSECVRVSININWECLLDQAIKMGCERILLLGLKLSHDVLNTALPDIILKKIDHDSECQNLAAEFSKRLFLVENSLDRKFTLEKFLIHLRMMNKIEGKLGCFGDIRRPIYAEIFKIMPNSKDKDFLSIPGSFYSLYYFIKPIRIIKNWLKMKND